MTISATLNTQPISGGMLTKFRSLVRGTGTGDSFNKDNALSFTTIDKATFTSSTVKTQLGGIDITYSNSSGAITWGGKKLNLTGFDPRTEPSLFIQEGANANEVNIFRDKAGKGFVLDLTTGKLKTDGPAEAYVEASFAAGKGSLIINNSSDWYASGQPAGTAQDDVIINRQAGGKIDAGGGNDQIFNFGTGAVELAGGAGHDALYTIANSGGTFDLSGSGDTYVKTLGNMDGSTVKLGAGKGLFDATGYTLTDMTIANTGNFGSAALIAKSIAGSSSDIDLTAAEVGIDVTTLSGALTLGAGKNSLVADTISATVTSTGTDSFQFKTASDGTVIDQSGGSTSSVINVTGAAKKAEFKFGDGENLLNALGKTLTSVTISDTDGASTETKILAGSITGTAGEESNITLTTDATITVSGAINYSDITTGNGVNTITAKTISNSLINTAAATGSNQTITVTGKIDKTTLNMGNTASINAFTAGSANEVTYTGGTGADNVAIKGAVSASSFNLGTGTNTFYATSTGDATGKGQAITDTTIEATGATTIVGGAYTAGASGNDITLEGAGLSHSVTLASVAAKTGGKLNMTLGGSTITANQTLDILGAVKELNYIGSDGDDNITIHGAISNSEFTLGAGNNNFTARKGPLGAYQAMSNVDITATGTGNKTVVTAGAYTAGKAGGNNFINLMGSTANEVHLNSVSGKKVGTDMSGLEISLGGTSTSAQTLEILGAAKDIIYTGAAGADSITIHGAISNASFALDEGTNTLTARKGDAAYQAMSNVDISSGVTGSTTITAGAYTAGKDGGNNSISLGGSAANTVTLNSVTGKKIGNDMSGLNIDFSTATGATQALTILGAAKDITYTGAANADSITIKGAVSESTFDLGNGANSFIAENDKAVGQKLTNVGITAGAGSDTITAGAYTVTDKVASTGYSTITLGDGTATINLSSIAGGKVAGNEATIDGSGSTASKITLNVTGTVSNMKYTGGGGVDELSLGGAVSGSTFDLGDGLNLFTAEKTLTDVTFEAGTGDDSITLKGAVSKSTFDLGDGGNELDASKQTLTDVAITGGAGKDIIKYGAYKGTKGTTHKIELGGGAENTIEIVA